MFGSLAERCFAFVERGLPTNHVCKGQRDESEENGAWAVHLGSLESSGVGERIAMSLEELVGGGVLELCRVVWGLRAQALLL